MIVPTEEALQELWLSHRVERAQREHRPHPDYSLFITEFETAIERIKADAWDKALEYVLTGTWTPAYNPYRKQEEA